jgi:hypothetical protein
MPIAIAKYAPSSSYTSRMLHLEGEKVFKSYIKCAYFPIGLKEDFHDYVNCFHLWTNEISTPVNIASYVRGGQSIENASYVIFNFMHNGVIMCANVCGHGVWCIEWCRPKSNI